MLKSLALAAVLLTVLPNETVEESNHLDESADSTIVIQPEEALSRLLEGNRRFTSDQSIHPHESANWRALLEGDQHPFAVILGCSDSRVPPELVFDQGFGDLFVVRVAGNVADTDVVASIEYAIHHCGSRLIAVMGHTGCGAVAACLDHLSDPDGEASEVIALLDRIQLQRDISFTLLQVETQSSQFVSPELNSIVHSGFGFALLKQPVQVANRF